MGALLPLQLRPVRSTMRCSDLNNSMIRIVEKDHNKIIRPAYKKVFFNILHHSFRISLQSLQKVLISSGGQNAKWIGQKVA